MRTRRFAIGAFVMLAATVGLTLTTASPAAAHNDACSKVIDEDQVTKIFNFHEACHAHDSCYRNKPFGNDSAGRKSCDVQFRNNMRGWCNNRWDDKWKPHHNVNRRLCKKMAETYYAGMRNLSQASTAFKNSGPGTYPYAPSVRAYRYSDSAGEIIWTRAWDPDGIVVRYEVYRNGKLIARVDALSLYQSGLAPGTYNYEIFAMDNHGKRAPRSARVTLTI